MILLRENLQFPDFLIENQLSVPLTIHQKNSGIFDTIPSFDSLPFAWDLPEEPKKVIIADVLGKKSEISFDSFTQSTLRVLFPGDSETTTVQINVEANGPSRVLRFRTVGNRSFDSLTSSVLFDAEEFFSIGDESAPIQATFNFRIGHLGVSVVSSLPQEILYCAIENLSCDLTSSPSHQTLELHVGRIQLNNQLPSALHPILLYSVLPENASNNFAFHLLVLKNSKVRFSL